MWGLVLDFKFPLLDSFQDESESGTSLSDALKGRFHAFLCLHTFTAACYDLTQLHVQHELLKQKAFVYANSSNKLTVYQFEDLIRNVKNKVSTTRPVFR